MVLKSCDKRSTTAAAAASTATPAAAGGVSTETSIERLTKDVTVNGGIHVNSVISTPRNSSVAFSSPADVTAPSDASDKHVRHCVIGSKRAVL